MRRLGFVTWTEDRPTGGNVYNAALVSALRRLGTEVVTHRVPGRWPEPDRIDQGRLATILRSERHLLVDGIVASGAPEAVAAAVAGGHRVTVLLHMPAADEVGLSDDRRAGRAAAEDRMIRSVSGVVTPSRHTADLVTRRHGRVDVGVARPGVSPAPLSMGSGPGGDPRLLTIAALTPTKDPITYVRALTRLRELPWTAHWVGSAKVDRGYAARVCADLETAGLGTSMILRGTRSGSALEAEWAAADLFVLPSRAETYGLVVAEALAHGIPAVVTRETGAVEALEVGAVPAGLAPAEWADRPERADRVEWAERARPGTAVRAGDPTALADVLRTWLTDPQVRQRWRAAAVGRRDSLPEWRSTAEAVLTYLTRADAAMESISPGSPPAQRPTPPPDRAPSTD
ncbi:MAG TPA: glycosyltransferase family 4 protein [Microlunatus sp.]